MHLRAVSKEANLKYIPAIFSTSNWKIKKIFKLSGFAVMGTSKVMASVPQIFLRSRVSSVFFVILLFLFVPGFHFSQNADM